MNKYNGGLIYPYIFHHNVDDPDDWLDDIDETVELSHIYSWEQFIKEQSYVGLDWRVDFVSVGEDITGNLILLRIADDDFGGIYFWYHNNDSWDHDDGPVPIGKVAPSFKNLLLEVLFSDDEPDVRWASFFREGTQKELSF